MKFLYIEIIFAVLISFVYCDCDSFKASIANEDEVKECVENSKGQIINLDIYLEYLNKTSFEKIGALTTLTQLKIEGNSDEHDVDLTPLKKLKNLVEFSIDGTYDFYDQTKNQLRKSCFSKFKKLKKLFLGDWVLSDEVLEDLTSLQKLENLVFYGNLENRYVEAFGSLSSLNTFDVYVRPLDEDIDLSPLNGLQNLEKMSFECRVHKVRSTHYRFTDNSFGGLSHLKKLYIYGLTFANYTAEDISNMSSIEEIEFHRCSYVESSSFEPFKKLNHLKTLIFSGYYYFKSRALTEFPEITSVKSLKKLVVSSVFAQMPENIGNLKNLQHLEITSGDSTVVPDSLVNLKKLKYLDLSSNDISSIPKGLSNMSNLEYLDLSGNNISTLPSDFNKLKNLNNLNLSFSGKLENVELIKNLKKLKTLDISGIELTSVPSWIKNLSNLESLNISSNGITTVSSSIGNLNKLTTLDLSGNLIEKLPSSIKKLTNLLILDLTNNGLVSIPTNVKYLKSLTDLNLKVNKITDIPDFIGDLKNLKNLYLYYNEVASISTSLSKLENLETIDLSENKISELPNIFGKMKNLKEINLLSNEFTSYPLAICEIPSLSELNLKIDVNNINEEIPECYNEINEFNN